MLGNFPQLQTFNVVHFQLEELLKNCMSVNCERVLGELSKDYHDQLTIVVFLNSV